MEEKNLNFEVTEEKVNVGIYYDKGNRVFTVHLHVSQNSHLGSSLY